MSGPDTPIFYDTLCNYPQRFKFRLLLRLAFPSWERDREPGATLIWNAMRGVR